MRLAYIHYLSDGDTALNHVRQFAEAAQSSGVDATVIPLDPTLGNSSEVRSALSMARGLLKRHLSFYFHEPKKLFSNLSSYRHAHRALEKARPDVVLVRNDLLSISALLAGRTADLPVVLEVNSPAAESRQYLDQYLHLPAIPEMMERWQLSKANRITVVSSALREHFIDQYDTPSDKFSVIPNGADLALFRPDCPHDLKVLTVLGGEPMVGFVGSFEKWHGPEILEAMVIRVAEARPDTRFILVGDGPGRGGVEQALRPLADRVLFTGRVPHARIPGVTALLDIAVMPESNFYGSPLKVIEWMAAGRAIVAPDYGPLCEIIDSGREGLLFSRGSLDELVDAVVRLVDEPDLRKQLGEAAHQRAVKSLSWRHNAEKVIDACQRAIEASSRSHGAGQ